MMEIVKGRSWEQYHTVLDTEDGPLSDLSAFVSYKSQIREKTAVKVKGEWENPLVTDVAVTVYGSVILMALSQEQTTKLNIGDYVVDLVGLKAGNIAVSILDPEVIRVQLRPTQL